MNNNDCKPALKHKNFGFTLIELVVTVTIIGILATMVVPVTDLVRRRSKEQELHASLRHVREAIDNYKKSSDEGHIQRNVGDSGYPATLQVLVEGVKDIKDPNHHLIFFLRRIPQDPFNTSDFNVSSGKAWGLRSYQSSSDNPSPGADVFDIYSLMPGKGLNGIDYKDW